MPSFLATLDTNGESSQPGDSGQSVQPADKGQSSIPGSVGVTWLQYFATGTVATTLAGRDDVRNLMLKQAFPAAAGSAVSVYSPCTSADKINKFWRPDGTNPNPDNTTKLNGCMAQNHYSLSLGSLITTAPESVCSAVAKCAGLAQ